MSTHLSKDRASLCLFTFADGRRCRTPRTSAHPHLCTYHARKESQSQAAQKVGRHLGTYFSGHYLSACDLSSALGHLFSAVAQGQIKPKTASTLAYLAQTLLQSIHLSQHEYINAFGTDSWRQAIRDSFDRLTPPEPEPQLASESELAAESESELEPAPEPERGAVSDSESPQAHTTQTKTSTHSSSANRNAHSNDVILRQSDEDCRSGIPARPERTSTVPIRTVNRQLPNNAASYLESTLAKLHQNK